MSVNNTKINITMPEELVAKIEEFAGKTSQTKSGFICQACRFSKLHINVGNIIRDSIDI